MEILEKDDEKLLLTVTQKATERELRSRNTACKVAAEKASSTSAPEKKRPCCRFGSGG